MFTINDHISDNSIQIKIKFTFTVYEYITAYEYILLSNLIYIYIYIYNLYNIYKIFIWSELYWRAPKERNSCCLQIDRIYIYIYIYICVFCLLQHCCNTYTRCSHWFHIHKIFSSWFYLIINTSRNSLPKFEHYSSYQLGSRSNLVKAFFVLYGEFLTGFKHRL